MINVTVREWHNGRFTISTYPFGRTQEANTFIRLCRQSGAVIDGVRRISA